MSRISSSLVQLSLLGLWLGAAAFFTIAVAPALFAALPARTLAGAVVGRLLPSVVYSGIIIGLAAVAFQVMADGAWEWRGRESAGAVMVAACAVAQFFVAPRIERLRAEIGGPLENLAVDDARRVVFGRLHGFSVAWLGVAMLAAAVMMVASARTLHARHDSRTSAFPL
jgi:hypothetical protein